MLESLNEIWGRLVLENFKEITRGLGKLGSDIKNQVVIPENQVEIPANQVVIPENQVVAPEIR